MNWIRSNLVQWKMANSASSGILFWFKLTFWYNKPKQMMFLFQLTNWINYICMKNKDFGLTYPTDDFIRNGIKSTINHYVTIVQFYTITSKFVSAKCFALTHIGNTPFF